jgi:hypothetical protein
MKRRVNTYGRYAAIVREAKHSPIEFRRPKVYRHGIDMYADTRVRKHLKNRLEEFRRQIQSFLAGSADSIAQCATRC